MVITLTKYFSKNLIIIFPKFQLILQTQNCTLDLEFRF